MECREVSEHLAACADEPSGRALWAPAGPAARAVEAHLRSCASCQADLAAYRQLGTALTGLADHTVQPPAWLHDTLIDSVHARLGRPAARWAPVERFRLRPEGTRALTNPRYAAAGGAVLLAGLAAGAVLIRGRRRRSAAELRPATAA
ncbi:MAG TPA: hypothetical protein VKY26_12510 [Actinomycetota bacterium]|nr:hypothetical protein [Actinomycetota bacterium]